MSNRKFLQVHIPLSFFLNRATEEKTDLSLIDKIELARVYQKKVNEGV